MNREIKFRCLIKKEIQKKTINKMVYDISLLDIYKSGIFSERGDIGVPIVDMIDSVFMQYTGIQDKNGVDIYEGDILYFISECNIISIIREQSYGGFAFNKHGRLDEGLARGDRRFTKGVAKKCRIIGNIYDNPDFIK